MRWKTWMLLAGLVAALACAGPSFATGDDPAEEAGSADAHAHAGEEEDAHGEEEGLVHLDARELEELGVLVRTAGAGKLGLALKVPGKVTMPTDRIAHAVPRVRGYVREVRATLGDRVQKGQVLAILVPQAISSCEIIPSGAVPCTSTGTPWPWWR